MALQNFVEHFSNTYQNVFPKVTVGKAIANMRFEPTLKYGESVTRIKYDISGVKVRDITDGSDRTVDSVTDSEQSLTINYHKGTTFQLTRKQMVQAGPLNPGSVIGGQVARKTAIEVDSDILFEATNATTVFDTGSLTTTSSSGTPITLSTSNMDAFMSRTRAMLRRNNQTLSNTAFVVDSIVASVMEQTLLGKNINLTDSVFKNGYSGPIAGSELYVSENLTGEAVLSLATQPTADDTIEINGVTFTFVASPSSPGDVDLGANVDETRLHLSYAILGTGSAGSDYTELSTDDRETIDALNISATNDDTANTLTLVARGSGRLALATTLTDGTDAWTKNFIHCYYGKKGAIDVVVQEMVDMEMLQEPKQRTKNVVSDAFYGIKTFDDGAVQFLDVHIAEPVTTN